jgi:hypothetical protein
VGMLQGTYISSYVTWSIFISFLKVSSSTNSIVTCQCLYQNTLQICLCSFVVVASCVLNS